MLLGSIPCKTLCCGVPDTMVSTPSMKNSYGQQHINHCTWMNPVHRGSVVTSQSVPAPICGLCRQPSSRRQLPEDRVHTASSSSVRRHALRPRQEEGRFIGSSGVLRSKKDRGGARPNERHESTPFPNGSHEARGDFKERPRANRFEEHPPAESDTDRDRSMRSNEEASGDFLRLFPGTESHSPETAMNNMNRSNRVAASLTAAVTFTPIPPYCPRKLVAPAERAVSCVSRPCHDTRSERVLNTCHSEQDDVQEVLRGAQNAHDGHVLSLWISLVSPTARQRWQSTSPTEEEHRKK